MKIKAVKIFLCLTMILSAVIPAVPAYAVIDESPKIGNEVHGFVVKELSKCEIIGADIILYEHEKTGALVMFVENEDTNRTFDITFRTPAENETGVSHVFEHSTLSGSEKYPSSALFFNLVYQTYNTYLNASTSNYMTTYPAASLSEEQLLKYADFYLDSCFNPMIMKEESIFNEEAWRYELYSEDEELDIAGTVYSEMLGAYGLSRSAYYNFFKTIAPGTSSGNDSGGNPDHITEMTWDDLKTYHEKYYHPSNSLTCIYGKIDDFDGFLALLDEYFSRYEKVEFNMFGSAYQPVYGTQKAVYRYAVSSNADVENMSEIYYGFAFNNLSSDAINGLDIFTTLMNADSSSFQIMMRDRLPKANGSCYINFSPSGQCVYFLASGVNEDDADLFKEIVDDAVEEIAKHGFDSDTVDASSASTRMSLRLLSENYSAGVSIVSSIANYWAGNNDLFGFMKFSDAADSIDAYAEDGTFQKIAEAYLVNNPCRALVTTVPVSGLREELDLEKAKNLAELKAGMSDEEISSIVEETLMLSAYDEGDDSSEYLKQLQAVGVESLPEETRMYDISDEACDDGIRRIDVTTDTEGIGQVVVMLDASGLKQNQLHYFKLYTDLLGELSTSSHTQSQISALMSRYLYGSSIQLTLVLNDDINDCSPYLFANFIALDEDVPQAYSILNELLYHTDFRDVEALKAQIYGIETEMKMVINDYSYSVQTMRAQAAANKTMAYSNYINGLDYYDFLVRTEELLESEPDKIVTELETIGEYFNNSNGAISGFIGSVESAALHRAVADEFLTALDSRDTEPAEYVFAEIPDSEAIAVDSQVQYNLLSADFGRLGVDGYDSSFDVISALVSDSFLYPMLRDKYGVYGIMHGATEETFYICTYSDPNIAETFEVYDQLPDLVREAAKVIDQETLDGYILSSYSYYATPDGELTGGLIALLNRLDGKDLDVKLSYMRRLKEITSETLTEYAEIYERLCSEGIRSTSGSAAAIENNAQLFKEIIYPLGSAA